MSRYGSGPDYHRDRRERSPPRFGDRRPSYNEPPRAPRGRELRDAPPLGRNIRDPREFPPRDADSPRPRRNSRDGPLSAGAIYPDTGSFRGGLGRGRGRGDSDFRGGRGGRRFDDRDSYARDRSPPRWAREERSPPRRDERRFDRREDGRWNDSWPDRERDRDFERWRDASSTSESRAPGDGQPANPQQIAGNVNPERLALIEDSTQEAPLRRASTFGAPSQSLRHDARRDQPDVPPYLSARTDSVSNKYPSRASSPPAQPPSVPAFTLSFTPTAQPKPEAIKTEQPARPFEAGPSNTGNPGSPVLSKMARPGIDTTTMSTADITALAPRAPKALERDQPMEATTKPHEGKQWESLSAVSTSTQPRPAAISPVLHSNSRSAEFIPPTGPKATRPPSHASQSPRVAFTEAPRALSQVRSRTPPPMAPSGPRAHAASRSPEMAFAAAPTGPKVDRFPPTAPRSQANSLSRPHDRPPPPGQARLPPTAPRSQQGWNLWRRDTLPNMITKRDSDESKHEPHVSEHSTPDVTTSARAHIDAAAVRQSASSPKGHSAQQSFFGQPANDQYDDLASDAADDSISSSEDDEIEVEDLALFEAKFKRRQRELEAKLIDLSAREYRATTPLETIARLATVTMQDVERFKERESQMDIDPPQTARGRPEAPPTQSSGSEEGADLPTPTGEENTSVLIHTDDGAEDDLRRIYRPAPEVISLPYMTRGPMAGLDMDLNFSTPETLQKDVEQRLESDLSEERGAMWSLEQEFAALYERWREICEDLDYEREKQEEIERQLSLEPGAEPDATPSTASNPIFEGSRRTHRWASEYEIEQVLKQSEETARIEREKADREAKRVQADMEKEAELPDQLDSKEYFTQAFIDDNRLRDPASLTVVFTYEPAIDNFNEEEQQIFVAAFRETPKKWTEIASLLPGREPKDCIRHYYTNKWDGRFRDGKHRRNKAGRRGRGGKTVRSRGATAMADLAGGEDMPVAVSDSGRPKRAAAPTTFAEKETEAKALLAGQSPAKRANVKQEGSGDSDKPVKRRKLPGEKTGRKPKSSQPLATIAAAPIMSPEGRPLQIGQSHDGLDRSRLEEASLLTGFYAGRPTIPGEQQAFAQGEKFMPRHFDDAERLRVPVQASLSKPSPSSYWSVPEQGDFMRYIAYFGTDFAAIAAHMGTKTQTMIKNHYQRQIEGSHPELGGIASAADAARQRGESIGAPPTPTPITKRKYDSAATVTQRSIVSHGEAMDLDEPVPTGRSSLNKHESPHQFSIRPQYPPTTAPTPQGSHAGPPLTAAEHSASLMAANTSSRTYQSSHGGRPPMFSDRPADGRASISGAQSFYPPASATAVPAPQHRTTQDSHDPYIRGLLEEQQRALRLQDQHGQDQEPVDPYYSRGAMQQQRSPHMHPMHAHQHERRPLVDHRSNTPPAPYFPARSTPGDRASHLLDPIRFPPPTAQGVPSPPKRDQGRVPPSAMTFAAPPSKPAEAPKRMDLFSMLNGPSEEPRAKRNSLDVAPSLAPRAASPAQHSSLAASPYSSLAKPRETYGQASTSQYPPHRASISHMPGPTRSPAPPTSSLKQESLPSGLPAKQEWPHRSNVHGMPPQPALPLERDVRPYYSHRSSLLGQSEPGRVDPSPPPQHSGMQHSRASSSADGTPRSYGGQASGIPGVTSAMYAPPAYSHAGPPSGTPAHSQHGQAYAAMHQRGHSRDDAYHRDQMLREGDREREEREWRYRRDRDEAQRHRYEMERQEHERHFPHLTAPEVMQQPPAPYSMPYESNAARMSNIPMSLREQSTRDAELAMQQQEERMRHGTVYGGAGGRERDQPQVADDARRRHDDAFLPASRRTPLGGGGGYGPPGMPGAGRR